MKLCGEREINHGTNKVQKVPTKHEVANLSYSNIFFTMPNFDTKYPFYQIQLHMGGKKKGDSLTDTCIQQAS